MTLDYRTKNFSRLLGCGLLTTLYGLLAVWSTWPLFDAATSKLSLGSSRTITVPYFNTWTIWWNADRLPHGFADYWNAPIFYPTPEAFAFSEPQPMTLLVAPVIWLTDSRALAYNVYLLCSLILNGLLTYRLLRMAHIGRFSSLIGGAAMILLPIVHWQSDVLQMVPLWGILWTWAAFLRTLRKPTVFGGGELGLAFAASFYCSVHHALMLAILIAGSLWIAADRWRDLRFWKAVLAAVFIGGGLTAPFVMSLRDAMARHNFERKDDQLKKLAARPGDYTEPAGQSWFNWGKLPDRRNWNLGLGKIASCLALIGIGFGLRRRTWRRRTLLFVAIAILGVLLSFGLDLRIGSWQPWRSLCAIVPGLSQVRSVFRFAYFVQISLVLLAAQGLYAIWLWKSARFGRTRWKRLFLVLQLLLGFLMVFEVRPNRPLLATLPDVRTNADWIAFVRESTPPGSEIACFPFAPGNLVQDFEPTVRWMYFGTFHGLPLVNGYSGFFPQSYFDVRGLINERFPEEQVFDRLRELNVAFVVIDSSAYKRDLIDRVKQSQNLEPAFESSSQIVVFRIVEDVHRREL